MPNEDVEPSVDRRICNGQDCENKATHRCRACKRAWYCSTACQRKDWTFHIFDCETKGNIRSAHYLFRACYRDVMPTDPQVLKDYGFSRTHDVHSGHLLCGLYRDFLDCHGGEITARDLDAMMKEGTLLQHIKGAFESLPPDDRGDHYAWFLENQWILDGSPIPQEHTADAMKDNMNRDLWDFLGPERKTQFKSWSKERKTCAQFYRLMLSNLQPGPGCGEMYINFGFCTVSLKDDDESHPMSTACLYRDLIHLCTFEEFCDAYESNSLVALIEAKFDCLGCRTSDCPRHFLHVMCSGSPPVRESVWYLKEFLYAEGSVQLMPPVIVDYGFFNCCNQRTDLQALTDAYRTAFDHRDFDEMEMHTHCMQGRIFDYVSKFQRFSKREKKLFARLMKNPHSVPGSNDATSQRPIVRRLLE